MTHRPERHMSEAEAVVQEARALERETRRETDELLRYEDDQPEFYPIDRDQAQYQKLLNSAESTVSICEQIQAAGRTALYYSLAESTLEPAESLVATIKAGRTLFVSPDPDAVSDKP